MSVLQAMGPCHLGRLLACESGHRDGPANFVTRDRRSSHAAGQRERRGQPKQQSCNTPIHGRSFHCLLMPAREPADYGEMRFEEGRISAKICNATVLTRIWQKYATGGAVSLPHSPEGRSGQTSAHPPHGRASAQHQRTNHGMQLALDKIIQEENRSVLITAF